MPRKKKISGKHSSSESSAIPQPQGCGGEGCPLCPQKKEGNVCCLQACCPTSTEICSRIGCCPCCILLVGGLDRLVCKYRQVIESSGSAFEHHTGSLAGGTQQLERSLQRSDVILCALNINSHGACTFVKQCAKKYGKKLYMLPSGSISSLKKVLEQSS